MVGIIIVCVLIGLPFILLGSSSGSDDKKTFDWIDDEEDIDAILDDEEDDE